MLAAGAIAHSAIAAGFPEDAIRMSVIAATARPQASEASLTSGALHARPVPLAEGGGMRMVLLLPLADLPPPFHAPRPPAEDSPA